MSHGYIYNYSRASAIASANRRLFSSLQRELCLQATMSIETLLQGCQTGAMALKIAPMNVFERQRPFYGRHVPAK